MKILHVDAYRMCLVGFFSPVSRIAIPGEKTLCVLLLSWGTKSTIGTGESKGEGALRVPLRVWQGVGLD